MEVEALVYVLEYDLDTADNGNETQGYWAHRRSVASAEAFRVCVLCMLMPKGKETTAAFMGAMCCADWSTCQVSRQICTVGSYEVLRGFLRGDLDTFGVSCSTGACVEMEG